MSEQERGEIINALKEYDELQFTKYTLLHFEILDFHDMNLLETIHADTQANLEILLYAKTGFHDIYQFIDYDVPDEELQELFDSITYEVLEEDF